VYDVRGERVVVAIVVLCAAADRYRERERERERKRKTLRNCRWLALPAPPSPGTLPPVFISVVVFFFCVSNL
jgi:hypothetical protein